MSAQKILIIDDSKLMRYQVKEMLPSQAQIFEAVDGEEGLEQIHHILPHLIILDCFMPKLNGWQVVNQMVTHPELSHIPVVLMTGRKDEIEGNAPNLFDYFVYDYFELMSKPFDRAMLFQAIKNAVQKAKSRNQIDGDAGNDALTQNSIAHPSAHTPIAPRTVSPERFPSSTPYSLHTPLQESVSISSLAQTQGGIAIAASPAQIATAQTATAQTATANTLTATAVSLDAVTQLQVLQHEVKKLRQDNQEMAQAMVQMKQELQQIAACLSANL